MKKKEIIRQQRNEINMLIEKNKRLVKLFKDMQNDNWNLHDRIAELLVELIKEPQEREVAQLRLSKDEDGQVSGFTIHAVNEEDIDVINTVRNRIFFGGTPNVEYSGRKEGNDKHAGVLKFTFKEI